MICIDPTILIDENFGRREMRRLLSIALYWHMAARRRSCP